MNPLRTILAMLRPAPASAEDIAAEADAERLADQNETIRLSQRSGMAGENYQSGRGSDSQ